MRNRFDRQLKELNEELVEMGTRIENAIQDAVNAMVSQDIEKAKEIISMDEEVDHMQREIESLCYKLLLQQQPVARDLRLISAAMKMVTDMERIGDHASDISELTVMLTGKPYQENLEKIRQMAKETMVMLVKSIEAFVNKDLEQAEQVIAHDDIVDDLFVQAKREMITLINENVENGEQAADLLMAAKYFERIGDHAANIAEWVIFSITGKHPADKG